MKLLLCIISVIGLTLPGIISTRKLPSVQFLKDVHSPVKLECMLTNCVGSAVGCIADKKCREAGLCVNNCLSKWDEDTTSEKYHVQNCTDTCVFSYTDAAISNFVTCLDDHKCLKFPSIPGQCKAPGNITILKQLSTSDLDGSWWVVGGRHPVYDCYPCGHLFFEQLNSTTWKYVAKYQFYLPDESLGTMHDVYYIPDTQPGSPISFVSHGHGMKNKETWYLVDGAEDGSYILQYYCGYSLGWHYDGFLILSRKKTLSPSTMSTTIADAIRRTTGLDLSTFCTPRTVGCATST